MFLEIKTKQWYSKDKHGELYLFCIKHTSLPLSEILKYPNFYKEDK